MIYLARIGATRKFTGKCIRALHSNYNALFILLVRQQIQEIWAQSQEQWLGLGGGGAMGLFGLGGCYRTDWVRGGCVMGLLG